MKTIEEKAKAYDEAIEVARTLLNTRCVEGTNGYFHRKDIEQMFPGLAESEDERIRKWIKKELESKYVVDNIVNNVIADKALAWLEKQGEQNISDNGIVENIKAKIIDHFDNHLMLDSCFSIGGLKNDILRIVNEVKQSKQKPADKVEPKFKVGDKELPIFVRRYGKTPIDAIYNGIVWLFESGYIKKGE